MKRAALLALLVAGCVSAGRFPQLARADRELFHRCWPSMQRAACGSDDRDPVYVSICIRSSEKEYADRRSEAARGKWLVSRGCLKDMVLASQDDDEDDGEDSK